MLEEPLLVKLQSKPPQGTFNPLYCCFEGEADLLLCQRQCALLCCWHTGDRRLNGVSCRDHRWLCDRGFRWRCG